MEILAMHRSGKSIRAIAKEAGRHRNTIKKHLLGGDFPRYRKSAARASILAPYVQAIQDYLVEDDYQATWILDRLKARGPAMSWNFTAVTSTRMSSRSSSGPEILA